MAKDIKEAEDNSIAAIVHQGKSIAEWEKILSKDFGFTQQQILAMVRSGVDLGRMLQGLDEAAKDIDDKNLFKGEEFFFETEDEEAALDEAVEPEDVVTVGDFIEILRRRTQLDDKIVFRCNKKEKVLFDVESKAGTAIVDVLDAKARMLENIELDLDGMSEDFLIIADLERMGKKSYPKNGNAWKLDNIAGVVDGKVVDFKDVKYARPEGYPSNGTFFLLDGKPASYEAVKAEIGITLSESVEDTPDNWKIAADWFTANGYPIEDDDARLDKFAPQGSQFLFKAGCSPTGKDEVISFEDAWKLYQEMSKEEKRMNEGRAWYGGGYGGTGRSYRRLGDQAPRGAEIGWYPVEVLDPKAKGKMAGWRAGPSNFPVSNDLLYGGKRAKELYGKKRYYKTGAMFMRNKYVKAGSESGTVQIALTSYFDAIKNNDEEAIKILKDLGIPLNLTFGLDPNDDYTMQYTLVD